MRLALGFGLVVSTAVGCGHVVTTPAPTPPPVTGAYNAQAAYAAARAEVLAIPDDTMERAVAWRELAENEARVFSLTGTASEVEAWAWYESAACFHRIRMDRESCQSVKGGKESRFFLARCSDTVRPMILELEGQTCR